MLYNGPRKINPKSGNNLVAKAPLERLEHVGLLYTTEPDDPNERNRRFPRDYPKEPAEKKRSLQILSEHKNIDWFTKAMTALTAPTVEDFAIQINLATPQEIANRSEIRGAPSAGAQVRQIWKDHMREMLRSGLMKEFQRGGAPSLLGYDNFLSFVKYFGVPKGLLPPDPTQGFARAITSAKILNNLLHEKAKSFRFPDHRLLYEWFRKLAENGLLYMSTADYKNYFYQIPLPQGGYAFFLLIWINSTYGQNSLLPSVLPRTIPSWRWIARRKGTM